MSEDTSTKRLFTQEMRYSTRSVHDASDKLVNLKLGVTLSEPAVWYEGLLVFEPIFRFLEEALDRHKDSLLGELDIPAMKRASAFKKDLDHFYGDKINWQADSESRCSVKNYLQHLSEVEETNPYLLIPYFYHLYMGLLSGGQILAKKRSFSAKFGGEKKFGEPGNSVTEFSADVSIGQLKKQIRDATNHIAAELDEETKKEILEEGIKVFQLNIEIIRSIRGVDQIFRRKIVQLCVFVTVPILAIAVYWFKA